MKRWGDDEDPGNEAVGKDLWVGETSKTCRIGQHLVIDGMHWSEDGGLPGFLAEGLHGSPWEVQFGHRGEKFCLNCAEFEVLEGLPGPSQQWEIMALA